MRNTKYILFFLVLWFCIPVSANAENTLQTKIDAALDGAIIEIEAGKYEETISLSKPITLEGKGNVILYACKTGPVVDISGQHVILKNIKVVHCGDQDGDMAIRVTGSKHILEQLSIETKRIGIKLQGAANVTVQNSEVVGKWKGNGIDLWDSTENIIANNRVSNVYDGIYLERSNGNNLSGNEIRTSRYGTHIMFSEDNVLKDNLLNSNITGTMVMSSKKTVVSHNTFAFSRNNVNAQGLLLYMATDTQVQRNTFVSNRVGIYTERSNNNLLDSNIIRDNFIGMQFDKADENTVVHNSFAGNVNDAQAIDSPNNQINHNYWDSSSKVDANEDGYSEIAFAADPYFLGLTADVPEYQLFFHSPGLILIQKMLKSPANQLLVDAAPLMDMVMEIEKEKSSNVSAWVIGGVMLFSSLGIFILGRKRQ